MDVDDDEDNKGERPSAPSTNIVVPQQDLLWSSTDTPQDWTATENTETTTEIVHRHTKTRNIRVVQWNALGFTPGKRDAFLHALKQEETPVDILLISETYRAEYDLIGSLKSEYASVHHCSYGSNGGTLVAIRNGAGLKWKRLEPQPLIYSMEQDGTMRQTAYCVSVEICPEDQRWSLTISSVYIPPGTNQLNMSFPSITGRHLLAGDFNAHDSMWDMAGRANSLGRKLKSWAFDNDYAIANDASQHTWQARTQGSTSHTSPDVTLAKHSAQSTTGKHAYTYLKAVTTYLSAT